MAPAGGGDSPVGPRMASGPYGILNRMRGSISRVRIESAVSQAGGIFGFVFAIQSLPAVIDSGAYVQPFWAVFMPAVVFASILGVVVTSLLRRGVMMAASVMASVFALSLVLWPSTVQFPTVASGTEPWLWYIMVLAMSCAVIAFPAWLAGTYIVLVALSYAVVRTLPSGGAASAALAALDALYAFLLGAFVLILLTTLRQAADRVDRAQGAAMLRYSVAVKQNAMEAERTHVDALVHDRVLTTLLTASKSGSAMERDLVVGMARDALDALHSADVTVEPGFEVELSELAARLEAAAQVLSSGIGYAQQTIPDRMVPGDVAEAVFSAAVQAMVNSLQHASPTTPDASARPGRTASAASRAEPVRTVSVHAHRDTGFTVQIADTGVGFDPHAVPQERLGLRVSIRERVAQVGGTVQVQSVPGGGTSIVIVWPDPHRATASDRLRLVLDPGEADR
jgi:signal transduction histidine kinase